jgi:hypothetical protein
LTAKVYLNEVAAPWYGAGGPRRSGGSRKQHLRRYLAEFDFRYNNRVKLGIDDAEREDRAALA